MASKHGVKGLTKIGALEYAQQNIRINSICPAAIETPVVGRYLAADPNQRESFEQMHPVGRTGQTGRDHRRRSLAFLR